jgi:hypothetical protein
MLKDLPSRLASADSSSQLEQARIANTTQTALALTARQAISLHVHSIYPIRAFASL